MPKGVYMRKAVDDSLNNVVEDTKPDAGTPHLSIRSPVAEIEAMRAELAAQLEAAKALTSKLELQTTVRSEVSEALRLQQEETKRQAFGKPTPSEAPKMPPKPDEELTTIKLDRHYCPKGYYEVVGYHKEAVFRKRPDGQVVETEKAEFIPNERKPPSIAGVGFVTKIWAGTVLRLPKSEAREIRNAKIGSVEID